MPASTPIYGLPYQVGSDPPCFGPGTGCDNLESVWCDFVDLVEAQLDENDAVVGRTGLSIPMARVSFAANANSGPLFIFPGLADVGYLAFDTVDFDTDNMASLPQGITPRRNGIYRIDATMFVSDPDDTGLATTFQIAVGNLALDPDVATLNAVVAQDGSLRIRASTLYEFSDSSPVSRLITLQTQSAIASTAELFSSSLTVYWHSDL